MLINAPGQVMNLTFIQHVDKHLVRTAVKWLDDQNFVHSQIKRIPTGEQLEIEVRQGFFPQTENPVVATQILHALQECSIALIQCAGIRHSTGFSSSPT